MVEKEEFIRLLKDIVDIARANDNVITTDEIKKCFSDRDFSKEQYEAIYDYMYKNNISVKGYIPKAVYSETDRTSGKNSHRMGEYKKSVNEIISADKDRLKTATEKLIYGNASAADKEYIIHEHLSLVINMAVKYANKGISSDELVQEGNLALVTAVNELNKAGQEFIKPGKDILDVCEKYYRDKVREYIIRLIDAESRSDSEFSAVVAKAGLVYEASRHLALELGKVASLKELSEYTHISEDEIQDIIRFSGYTISLGDDKENIN